MAHLGGIYSAVKMLKDRLTVLYSVMDKMEKGEIEMDHGLMREIAGLARRVPFLDTDDFQKSFLKVRDLNRKYYLELCRNTTIHY